MTMREWLRQTAQIEVHRDEDGPYATPGTAVGGFPYQVWATNGLGGPEAAGTLLARCRTEWDTNLVADALRAYKEADPEPSPEVIARIMEASPNIVPGLIERIQRVKALHTKVIPDNAAIGPINRSWCAVDGRNWPCPTIEALDLEEV